MGARPELFKRSNASVGNHDPAGISISDANLGVFKRSIPAKYGKPCQRHRGQMSETKPPAKRRVVAGKIQAEAYPEWTKNPPRISAHAVKPHRGAPQRRVRCLDRARSKRRTVPEYRSEPGDNERRRH